MQINKNTEIVVYSYLYS